MNEEQTRLFKTDDDEIPASQSNEEKTTSEQGQESSEEERIKDQTVATSEEHGDNVETQIQTRSGRVIKKPIRFNGLSIMITLCTSQFRTV